MSLTLTITSYQRLSPGQVGQQALDRGQLTIGRAAGNDWELPDPEMVLSKQHCLVEYRDGDYYITDTSTNGIFINHSDQRLGRGNSVRLNDADIISLGDYELQVRIGAGAAPGPEAPSPATYLDEGTDLFSAATEQIDVNRLQSAVGIEPPAPQLPENPLRLPEDSDPLGLSEPTESTWQQHSEADHLASDREFFQPPAATPESPAGPPPGTDKVIPDDWEDSLILKPPGLAAREPADDSATEHMPIPPPSASQAPTTATPAAQAPAATADDSALLQAFLRGAGLDAARLQGVDPVTLMEQLGTVFRQTTQGMMELLRARSSVKNEFRVERTVLGPTQNNPLKALPSVEEAMAAMLTRRDAIWMPAERAVTEGFADLRAHELALLAGMQAALKQLLGAFDPQSLEQELSQHSFLAGLFSGGRKARYWDAFTQLYGKLAAKAEDDFQELFRKEFAQAYEDQQNKLRQG